MAHRLRIATAVYTIVTALGLAVAEQSSAEEVGVFGLFRVTDPAAYSTALDTFASSTAALGCVTRREGSLSSTQGPLALPSVNRFLLLNCKASLLAVPAGGTALKRLAQQVHDLVLLEGDTRWSGDDSPVAERAYLIKLSRFNNRVPGDRDAALASLGREAATLPHAYVNEAVMAVDRALGIPRPDDVTVLYYHSATDGEKFRSQNPDVLKRIGEFNKTHLDDFVYVNGSAER